MWTRRDFLNRASVAGAALMIPGWLNAAALSDEELTKLLILHTNDIHSRVEPFPEDGSKNAGLGGAARRAALIEKFRKENEHVLLLDSGDIFQGTPYFNFFLGELDIKLMTQMGYEATTMGNHDFDGGLENFEKQMREHGNFPMINANYDFSDTVMHDKYLKRHVIQKGNIKIGLTGVGIELDGLVPQKLYGNTKYLDPIKHASEQADILKHDEKCDLVICLSHLGYRYDSDKVSDIHLAKESKSIDLILGGHTHTFMDAPDIYRNVQGHSVVIHQVGWAGMRLGKIDVSFELNKRNKCISCDGVWVTDKN
ncbi:MAG TPA: metallophosphatase [Saprospiraceae bacterium]|nr:metallophosphatase [Saprospiraceae bacterium]